jgi:hypothetical protein
MHPDQIALVHGLKHLFSEGPVYVLVMLPPGRFVTQIIGQVMQQWPDAGIGKTLVECGKFFLAEKHRDAAMFFGQLQRDFLSPAFFGKRSTRPTDPLSLVLYLGKSFQRSHEPTEDLMTRSSSTVTGKRLETLMRVLGIGFRGCEMFFRSVPEKLMCKLSGAIPTRY